MTPRPDSGRRSGASLVFAVFAVAALVSLALSASAMARGRAARAASRAVRAELRGEAEAALARALHAVDADTNGVDCLSEPWAIESAAAAEAEAAGRDGVFVVVSDEKARLGVPECGEVAFAALLSEASGLDAAASSGLARAVFAGLAAKKSAGAAAAGGGDGAGDAGKGAVASLVCEEELLGAAASAADREALDAAMPLLSAAAGAEFNANTAPREVVVAAALAGGATAGGAEGLWLRLEMARGRGDVFASASPSEAMKLLRGEGDVPTPDEMAALSAVQPRLCVESGLFRVRALARRGRLSAAVECVYERSTGRILRWAER